MFFLLSADECVQVFDGRLKIKGIVYDVILIGVQGIGIGKLGEFEFRVFEIEQLAHVLDLLRADTMTADHLLGQGSLESSKDFERMELQALLKSPGDMAGHGAGSSTTIMPVPPLDVVVVVVVVVVVMAELFMLPSVAVTFTFMPKPLMPTFMLTLSEVPGAEVVVVTVVSS